MPRTVTVVALKSFGRSLGATALATGTTMVVTPSKANMAVPTKFSVDAAGAKPWRTSPPPPRCNSPKAETRIAPKANATAPFPKEFKRSSAEMSVVSATTGASNKAAATTIQILCTCFWRARSKRTPTFSPRKIKYVTTTPHCSEMTQNLTHLPAHRPARCSASASNVAWCFTSAAAQQERRREMPRTKSAKAIAVMTRPPVMPAS
mmetsp:Transcript_9405/g.31104  ORF Transcript_9405/g.31104 Transcript_9405/m.31104 type:complete len:206 (+) Transcript_9405:489-1106(+)